MLSYEEIKKDPQMITKIRPIVYKYTQQLLSVFFLYATK